LLTVSTVGCRHFEQIIAITERYRTGTGVATVNAKGWSASCPRQ
jgi:hypothetical protein